MKKPRQNRINPKGELVAHPAYGTFMGNRGVLHDAEGIVGHRTWRHKNWIICQTAFRGRRRPIMAPNRYTELFFLDEVTALAAGHRPCAECRHAQYTEFRQALARGGVVPEAARAADLDARLHGERAWPGKFRQRRWEAPVGGLPDGAMIERAGRCLLVAGPWLLEWAFDGYSPAGEIAALDGGAVTVLTPATSVAALKAGYQPAAHESAIRILAGLAGGRPIFSAVAGQ